MGGTAEGKTDSSHGKTHADQPDPAVKVATTYSSPGVSSSAIPAGTTNQDLSSPTTKPERPLHLKAGDFLILEEIREFGQVR